MEDIRRGPIPRTASWAICSTALVACGGGQAGEGTVASANPELSPAERLSQFEFQEDPRIPAGLTKHYDFFGFGQADVWYAGDGGRVFAVQSLTTSRRAHPSRP